MFLLKLAFLNIGRNPRRSVITVLAVGVGLAALIFLWGFSDGTNEQMRSNVIRLFTGHLQVHAAGFEKAHSPELTVTRRDEILSKASALKGFVASTERAKCEALIGTSERSRGILLIGIDPVRERTVTELEKYIKKGRYLEPSDNRSILIGGRLAKRVEADVGDKLVVMTQSMDGNLAGYAYRVAGILHTGSQQIDEMAAYITLDSARELLAIGEESHELVFKLKDRRTIPGFLSALSGILDTGHEILRWDEIVPEVEQWAQWAEAIIQTILIAVMVVIGVSIMNTVLMSVFERTREIGVMLALGTSPKRIIGLILLETIVLECWGILLGLAVGYSVVGYFGVAGIAFPELEAAFSRSYMSTVTYTRVETIHVVQSVVTLLALTTLISLYPAWKAGRMEPVKAIYHS